MAYEMTVPPLCVTVFEAIGVPENGKTQWMRRSSTTDHFLWKKDNQGGKPSTHLWCTSPGC
jgi:hypothetical protein